MWREACLTCMRPRPTRAQVGFTCKCCGARNLSAVNPTSFISGTLVAQVRTMDASALKVCELPLRTFCTHNTVPSCARFVKCLPALVEPACDPVFFFSGPTFWIHYQPVLEAAWAITPAARPALQEVGFRGEEHPPWAGRGVQPRRSELNCFKKP